MGEGGIWRFYLRHLILAAVVGCGVAGRVNSAETPIFKPISDFCFAAKGSAAKGRIGALFERRVREVFASDPWKIGAMLYAFPQACRTDLISLSPKPGYSELLASLHRARKEYEATGGLSRATVEAFDRQGVRMRNFATRQGDLNEWWQLIIDAGALTKLDIRTPAVLAGNGLMFVEAYHQLSRYAEFDNEQKIFLDAIERSAREIVNHSDDNGNGIVGWGRLWLKERDGVIILHSSVPIHNLYFGGYTYFPRVDSSGRPICERVSALKEETFDHAYNLLFLLETYLITRDRRLAEDIIYVVGKSFDDTFNDGGNAGPRGNGWYYWKQLATNTGVGLPSCVFGREVKNTNLNMGVVLRLYVEVLKHNENEAVVKILSRELEKYVLRAEHVISTNDWEIFHNNNFGYQGVGSRTVELDQEPSSSRLLYDRTQKEVDLNTPFLRELREIIAAGNQTGGRKTPLKVILCTGDVDTPIGDVGTGNSCWNHLGFEAQDYFRLMRYEGLWSATGSKAGRGYLDTLVRNLAAASVAIDGRADRYARCFPSDKGSATVGETIDISYYGYFCMARKIWAQPAVGGLPRVHREYLERISSICDSAPPEVIGEFVNWRRGHTFYELYLSSDRLHVAEDDWLLSQKVWKD